MIDIHILHTILLYGATPKIAIKGKWDKKPSKHHPS